MVTAIQNGAEVSEEDLQKLQTIVDFLSALELAGVGENITAGIGDAMTAAGWDADAESVAGNLEAALNAAFVIHSPSQRVRPIGENVAAGVGEGMADYDLSADAEALAEKVKAAIETALPADALTLFGNSAAEGLSGALTGYPMAETGRSVVTNVKSAVSGSLNASTLRPVGVNAMAGLKAGILAGRSGVISAMRSAARDAVNAVKRELKIKSPSGVFRDEVGRMFMRGFSEGVEDEMPALLSGISENMDRIVSGAQQVVNRGAYTLPQAEPARTVGIDYQRMSDALSEAVMDRPAVLVINDKVIAQTTSEATARQQATRAQRINQGKGRW